MTVCPDLKEAMANDNNSENNIFKTVKRDGISLVDIKPLITNDSKKVLVASDNILKVFNLKGGELLQELRGHKHKVVGLGIDCINDDNYLSCDDEATLIKWNLNSSKEPETYKLCIPSGQDQKVCDFMSHCGVNWVLVVTAIRRGNDFIGVVYTISFPFNKSKARILTGGVHTGSNKVAMSKTGDFVAAIKKNMLLIKDTLSSERKSYRHKLGGHLLNCVVTHPSEQVVATGDHLGRVTLWYNILQLNPTKKILHWHNMPVGDLAFSHTGVELFSGGSEAVVVRWQLSEGRRYFMPRLGMPICKIATDSSNTNIIIGQVDNRLTILGGHEWKRQGIIQGLATNIQDNPFPSGLIVHPSTKSIIMNANCGHLQFYDIHKNRQLFQVDITMRNYVTEERENKITNIEVVHTAISCHGNWLITFEAEYPFSDKSYDYRLKFWQFKVNDQRWHLNTCVDMPHDVHISGIDIQPTSSPEHHPLCVTFAPEGKFKLWQIVDDSDIHRENVCWNCTGTGGYLGLPLQTAAFTHDGSMLAVAFESTLTMWMPHNCQIKGSLSQPYISEDIEQIIFGRGEGNLHLVIVRTRQWLCCWNLLTCCLIWRVFVATLCLVSDPHSSIIVGFTNTNDVFAFEPKECKPVVWQTNCVPCNVTKAVFVPSCEENQITSLSVPWSSHSILCFIDNNKTLNTLEAADWKDENMEINDIKVHQVAGEPAEATATKSIISSLLAQSKTHTAPVQIDNQTPISVEASTTKFMTELLNGLTVHHMEAFENLAVNFCNLIIPASEMRHQNNEPDHDPPKVLTENNTKNKTSSHKKTSKKILGRLENIDFDSVVNDLL